MNIRICGIGRALPSKVVTNDDLSKIMDTSDEWIRTRTGISTRHLATEETTTSLAVEAVKNALEDAGAQPEEIDLIVGASATPDNIVPSLACEVQAAIGAEHAVAFDVTAGCSGFLFAMAVAQAYIASGKCKTAIIIGAEVLSKIMDWTDRSTCVLFGDGAGAAVLRADEDAMCYITQGSDGSRGGVLSCANRPVNNPYKVQQRGHAFVHMEGQEVFKFAVRTVPIAIDKLLEEAQLAADDVDWFFLHQANKRIIESVAKRLGQPMEKFPVNITDYANTSAASVPNLLTEWKQSGQLKRGQKIILAGFGAGLTWGAALLTW